MGQIGGRHALAHAPSQNGAHRVEFARAQLPVEHGIEFAERQLERMQDEIDGFIARVMRAVAEGEAGALELRAPPRAIARATSAGARGSGWQQQAFEYLPVDGLERIECIELDVLVQLVDGGVDRTEFQHLRADVDNEAAVGSAAAGGQLGLDAGDRAHRGAHGSDQLALGGEERGRGMQPVERVIEPVPVEDGMHPAAQGLGRARRGVAEIELRLEVVRGDIAGAGAAADIGNLPAGGRKKRIAAIPFGRGEFGQGRRKQVHRVLPPGADMQRDPGRP